MANPYTATFPIRYQDTDRSLRLSPLALMSMMQEAAIMQSEAVGRGFAWLSAHQAVWMIVQTRIHILRLPGWRTPVTVATWPSDMGRLLSRREFIVSDPDGEWARATTLWAYVDTSCRRVGRVPPEMIDAFPTGYERAIAGPFPRPARCGQPCREELRPIRMSDIDSNGHVNNLRYLAWMLDSLPADLPRQARLAELNIRYQKEALPGGRILVRCQALDPGTQGDGGGVEGDGGGVRYAHEVRLEEGGLRIAMAESRWALPDR